MRKSLIANGIFSSIRKFTKGVNKTESSSSGAVPSRPVLCANPVSDALSTVEDLMYKRYSCRTFDSTRKIDSALLQRILRAVIRSPTAFNLQNWLAVVVTDPAQRARLCGACQGQAMIENAPATVVFVGHLRPLLLAPAVVELEIQSGHQFPSKGGALLRMIEYQVHEGPAGVIGCFKDRSARAEVGRLKNTTGLPSPPTSLEAYAWKQVMIPATNFVTLCTAAGLNTSIMEGINQYRVLDIIGLDPALYSVPVIVSVGYSSQPPPKTPSPRFPFDNFVHYNRYGEHTKCE